jgi:hypothetical protein
MVILGCEIDPETITITRPPEEMGENDRWIPWNSTDSTAIVTAGFLDKDSSLCVIVSGTAMPTSERWKGQVGYKYTVQKDATYQYVFNAWTESGFRTLAVGYHGGGLEATQGEPHLEKEFIITTTPTDYTLDIEGFKFPKSGVGNFEFKCADQIGTFYLKIISITKL